MLASSGDVQSGSQHPPHPRRPPPHLSVSLRRVGPAQKEQTTGGTGGSVGRSAGPLMRLPSDESSGSNEGAERWFDKANKRPGKGLGFPGMEDEEPPYFLPHNSSRGSKEASVDVTRLHPAQFTSRPQKIQRSATGGSSVGDYRSVIDDLTIENQKLKQELRKLRKSNATPLQNDSLFEVKIHGTLSSRKRRELEDVLGSFASNIDESSEKATTQPQSSKPTHTYSSLDNSQKSAAKHSSSSNTSNSRLPDSAYASMSNSGPTSLFTPTNGQGFDGKKSSQPVKTDQNIHTFLHNIPEGLLPKHSPLLTERQKKKLVVQKLEELFTGKKGIIVGANSQPLQQQEVSASAAKADQAANNGVAPLEGLREAHILPYISGVDNGKSKDLTGSSGNPASMETCTSDTSSEASPSASSPHQRPTRPLDLDPDRAQVPSENIDYIRHLGLSTPNFKSETSSDSTTATDADGWVYLNLLTSMAQLHIINVTPDFVRDALLDVSERFQVSNDGKKVRWRGGTQRTRMSSDEENQTTEDSDSLDEPSKKKRKVDGRRFAPVPVDAPEAALDHTKALQTFHYKPLFNHAESSGSFASSDESEYAFGYNTRAGGWNEGALADPQASKGGPGRISTQEKQEAGLLVYYAGAKFCTDLSGDRDRTSTPVHFSAVDQDGYFNSQQGALGNSSQKSAPVIERTSSGSLLPFRPFKDYSKGAGIPGLDDPRPRTPDLLDDKTDDEYFVNRMAGGTAPLNQRQTFDSTGLGGTRPADHFIMRVETRRTIRDGHKAGKSSFTGHKQSSVPKTTLDCFFKPGTQGHKVRRASFAKSPALNNLPIRTEILSSQTKQLEPSELPPPLSYHAAYDSSDSDSDSDSGSETASSRSSRTQHKASYLQPQDSSDALKHSSWVQQYPDEGFSDGDEEDSDGDEDEEGSIDMLADARRVDPDTVRREEMEFDEMGGAGDDQRTDVATVNESVGEKEKGFMGLRRGMGRRMETGSSAMSVDDVDTED
ncbi:hypothetical protein VTL71DRAFT_11529 [Oculimacula yallundae]|uniref:Frequency clock protein n=1 Tax=Oculimacula yallundae TaxID=86028 RepID=A0ABR4CS28_9HELO